MIQSGPTKVQLGFSPIRAEWVIGGNPVTNTKLLSTSADGTASTLLWDCSAGRFNWYYDIDETIYFLDGAVSIKDETGAVRQLGAGDWLFFPAGSRAEWTVDNYVRKIAFCRTTLPKPVLLLRRVYRLFKRLIGRGASSDGPSMFQSS
jgi:uncharacterized cupin superfamily protein